MRDADKCYWLILGREAFNKWTIEIEEKKRILIVPGTLWFCEYEFEWMKSAIHSAFIGIPSPSTTEFRHNSQMILPALCCPSQNLAHHAISSNLIVAKSHESIQFEYSCVEYICMVFFFPPCSAGRSGKSLETDSPHAFCVFVSCILASDQSVSLNACCCCCCAFLGAVSRSVQANRKT